MWALLRKFKERGNLMGCASNGEEPQVAAVAPQMGLVLNHAYSLLDVWEGQRRNGERIKLLKLRNPWGEGEWKGKWRSGCDMWRSLPVEVHRQLGYVNANDGTFFMSFDDFYLFFEKIYLCKLFPKEWERNKQSVQLKWEGRAAGCEIHITTHHSQINSSAWTPQLLRDGRSCAFLTCVHSTTHVVHCTYGSMSI
eukprot:COSAG02_NODE_11082_length_1796_cov_56.310548_1_plen_195_part_00